MSPAAGLPSDALAAQKVGELHTETRKSLSAKYETAKKHLEITYKELNAQKGAEYYVLPEIVRTKVLHELEATAKEKKIEGADLHLWEFLSNVAVRFADVAVKETETQRNKTVIFTPKSFLGDLLVVSGRNEVLETVASGCILGEDAAPSSVDPLLHLVGLESILGRE